MERMVRRMVSRVVIDPVVVRQRAWSRRMIAALASLGAFLLLAPRAYSHPLHTTLTEVTVAPDGGVQIVLRAFVDDFAAAIAGHTGPAAVPVATPTDSATARYLAGRIDLVDATGRPVRLVVAGIRRTGDLVWVTLRAPALHSVTGARLMNRVLFDRYEDQVNIVQTSLGGRRRTLLFTKREGLAAKAM